MRSTEVVVGPFGRFAAALLASLVALLVTAGPDRQAALIARAESLPALDRFRAVDSLARAEMAATGTPGAAIAVVSGDSVVWSAHLGVISVETAEPVTPETIFRVASTTKMLVAAAFSVLAERDEVALDAPIASWVSKLDPALGRLTLHQLLTHTAGLADESSYSGPHDEGALESFVRSWTADRLFTEPGAVYSYSNPGYVLAGRVLEAVTDTTFDAAMAALVFRPLGMQRSTFLPEMAMTRQLAQAHDAGPAGPTVVRPFPDDARFRPNGGAFTTALEFARFACAVVNDGRLEGRQVIDPGAVGRLTFAHFRRPGGGPRDSSRIAYGLLERRLRGVRVLQHGGARLGSGSVVRLAPDHRFGVVILTNRTGSYLPRTLERITEILLPLGPSSGAEARVARPWRGGENQSLAGTYVNHPVDLVLQLVTVGDGLRLGRPGSPESEIVEPIGDDNYRFAGQEFEVLRGPNGRPAYVHAGGRAFRRVDRPAARP